MNESLEMEVDAKRVLEYLARKFGYETCRIFDSNIGKDCLSTVCAVQFITKNGYKSLARKMDNGVLVPALFRDAWASMETTGKYANMLKHLLQLSKQGIDLYVLVNEKHGLNYWRVVLPKGTSLEMLLVEMDLAGLEY